jgi:hypothetical protein
VAKYNFSTGKIRPALNLIGGEVLQVCAAQLT